MSREIYLITITNFSKYNSGLKKGHKSTLISNKFCEDAKLRILPITSRWLFLNLVLTCGDHCRETVELSSSRLREMLECNRNIDRVLDQLQQLQLVTYEKSTPFINRIEKNRIEKNINRIEAEEQKSSSPPATFDAKTLDEVLSSLGKEKADAWKELYAEDEEFIVRELRKAWQYYALDNPKKKPKSKRGWSQSLSSWLERGWGYRAKNSKGNVNSKIAQRDEGMANLLSKIENGEL